jgi:CRISPR/Cas system endoribonuclease Cas6 (RAMP superfamily)
LERNFTVSELSEEFIQELYDKLDWNEISQYQYLSEIFIEDFQYLVDWKAISVSEPF